MSLTPLDYSEHLYFHGGLSIEGDCPLGRDLLAKVLRGDCDYQCVSYYERIDLHRLVHHTVEIKWFKFKPKGKNTSVIATKYIETDKWRVIGQSYPVLD